MHTEGNIGFDAKELAILCYHHMVAVRFLDERHQMQRQLGLTTKEIDEQHAEAQDISLSINDKLEPFMEYVGISGLLSEQLDKLFLKAKDVQEITKILKDLKPS